MNKQLAISNIINWALHSNYAWPNSTCLNMIDRYLMLTVDRTINPELEKWTKFKSEKLAIKHARKTHKRLSAAYESILDTVETKLHKLKKAEYTTGDIIIINCKVVIKESGEIVSAKDPNRSTIGLAISDNDILMASIHGFVLGDFDHTNIIYRPNV